MKYAGYSIAIAGILTGLGMMIAVMVKDDMETGLGPVPYSFLGFGMLIIFVSLTIFIITKVIAGRR